MTILLAPFAARQPQLNGSGSPKDYPWTKDLVALIIAANHNLIQVGGEGDEQVAPDFRKNLIFEEVGRLIESCDTAICVDSYLQHHCWYLNKKAIVLWGISDPQIFGHSLHNNLLKDRKYLRQNQFDLYYDNQHRPEAFVTPEEVVKHL
jgi:ADP-heptose:LPS heptosyltransferase